MIMASADLDQRSSLRRSAGLVDDLPQWRDRLEQLWRLNIEEIIELSLAYHGAASARRVGAGPELAGRPPASRLRRLLARTASAHHALAEVEAALGRIDAASHGICEQCGLRMQAGWLEACPQIRHYPDCRPQSCRRGPSYPAGSGMS